MRHNPAHAITDEPVVRALVAAHPWATIVSTTDDGPVASHYPVLLDDGDDLALVTHVGRPDERVHAFGEREVLVIVAGPHGYISPSWYSPADTPAPTWNFSVAHLYGVPEILEPEDNLAVLTRLVDHFERHVAHPVPLDQETGRRLARGTVGLRIPVRRFVCKVKMSQDKDERTRRQVLAELRGTGPYADPALADAMTAALGAPGELDG